MEDHCCLGSRWGDSRERERESVRKRETDGRRKYRDKERNSEREKKQKERKSGGERLVYFELLPYWFNEKGKFVCGILFPGSSCSMLCFFSPLSSLFSVLVPEWSPLLFAHFHVQISQTSPNPSPCHPRVKVVVHLAVSWMALEREIWQPLLSVIVFDLHTSVRVSRGMVLVLASTFSTCQHSQERTEQRETRENSNQWGNK